MKIYFASDHAGFELKKVLVPFVQALGHEAVDLGPSVYDQGDDYPALIRPAAEAVARDLAQGIVSRAVIFGASGQGEAMVANRTKGIRATVYYGSNAEIIRLSREHNDANVLSFGAQFVGEEEARDMLRLWLDTAFSGAERHQRRIAAIDA